MTAERRARVAELAAAGLSDVQIAARLGVSARTVLRDRQRDGVPSRFYELLEPLPHGESRYGYGCRCDVCRAEHAAYHRAYRLRTGRQAGTYRRCAGCGRRVRVVDDVAYVGNGFSQRHACSARGVMPPG